MGLGDVVLLHAAAGGVGQFTVQLAKRAGARVLGTVSTEEKAAIGRSPSHWRAARSGGRSGEESSLANSYRW